MKDTIKLLEIIALLAFCVGYTFSFWKETDALSSWLMWVWFFINILIGTVNFFTYGLKHFASRKKNN